jgi:hypothetical protein
MGKFYSQLSKGKSVSDALRDAQLEMIQDFGKQFPPYYWAGFSVIGDGTKRTPLGPPRLSQAERAKVFDKACSKVAKLYFDPAFRGVDGSSTWRKNRESVISRADPVEFEAGVHEIFRALGTSHTGFFHESVRRVPYRLAIGVTCTRQPKSDSTSWSSAMFMSGAPAPLLAWNRVMN